MGTLRIIGHLVQTHFMKVSRHHTYFQKSSLFHRSISSILVAYSFKSFIAVEVEALFDVRKFHVPGSKLKLLMPGSSARSGEARTLVPVPRLDPGTSKFRDVKNASTSTVINIVNIGPIDKSLEVIRSEYAAC